MRYFWNPNLRDPYYWDCRISDLSERLAVHQSYISVIKLEILHAVRIQFEVEESFPSTLCNFDLCASPHLCCASTSSNSRLCIGCSNHQSKANVRPKTLLGRRVDSHLKLFVEQNAFPGFPSAAKLERSFRTLHQRGPDFRGSNSKCPDFTTLRELDVLHIIRLWAVPKILHRSVV